MLFVSTSLAMPSGKIHTKNLLPAAMDCRTVFTGHPSLMVPTSTAGTYTPHEVKWTKNVNAMVIFFEKQSDEP